MGQQDYSTEPLDESATADGAEAALWESMAVAAENDEPWLMSYADLMTLLVGFFAMLFTFASFEDNDTVKVKTETARYFGGSYVSPIDKITKDMKFVMGNSPYRNDVDLKATDDGLEVSFISSVVFKSGSAEVLPAAIPPLQVLAGLVKDLEKGSQIRVEGHTDDNPIRGSVFPSNWELSAARAAAVARLFEKEGFPAEILSIAGYGSSRPAFPNRGEDGKPNELNQGHNRRVVVKVILPRGQKKNSHFDTESDEIPIIK